MVDDVSMHVLSADLEEADDPVVEGSLRPKSLAQYIGQREVKSNLSVLLPAAKGRGEAADHILLYGPPGLGKTTLATIIARDPGGKGGYSGGRGGGGGAPRPHPALRPARPRQDDARHDHRPRPRAERPLHERAGGRTARRPRPGLAQTLGKA